MARLDSWVVSQKLKEQWRCVLMDSGELSLITCGAQLMPESFAGSWGPTLMKVSAWSRLKRETKSYCFSLIFSVAVGFGQATFGPGVGVIHLDNVRCRGDETNILDCPSSRETSEDFHDGDAGVRCYLPGSG